MSRDSIRVFTLFVFVLLVVLPGLVLAEQAPGDRKTESPRDFHFFRDVYERLAVAERIIQAREGSRPFAESYKRHLLLELAKLPLAELLEMERTGEIRTTAIGDTDRDLVYTPVAPCRVFDTRSPSAIVTGGTIRTFFVADHSLGVFTPQGGNPNGCGIPYGSATAVHMNVTVVTPAAIGYLTGWAYGTSQPGTSILNYNQMTPNLNLANAVTLPICNPSVSSQCTSGDLNIYAHGTTHLVGDVLGYFSRFPTEARRSFAWNARYDSAGTVIGSTCTHHGTEGSGAHVTVLVPELGTMFVEGNAVVQVNHSSGSDDLIELYVGTSSTDCTAAGSFISRHLIPAAAATAGNYQMTIPVSAVFTVDPAQSTTATYFVNARNLGSTAGADTFVASTITVTFHPD